MAASFVEYKQLGFWCPDAYLEVWLAYAVHLLDSQSALPTWLQQVKEEWAVQASVGFIGCIELGLDRLVPDAALASLLLDIAQKTNRKLSEHGPIMTAAELNGSALNPPGSVWVGPVETTNFQKVGQLLILLLTGCLETTTKHNTDYLEPDKWRVLLEGI